MAQRASNRGVLTRQRETRGAVVERSSRPSSNGMARGALRSRGRKTSGDVIRNIPANGSRALERGRVATITIRRIQRVVVIGMAGSARCRRVCAHQGKSGDAVVERGCIPTRRGVTVGAIR